MEQNTLSKGLNGNNKINIINKDSNKLIINPKEVQNKLGKYFHSTFMKHFYDSDFNQLKQPKPPFLIFSTKTTMIKSKLIFRYP